MKIWVATCGSYSDYSVIGLFSTKEAAQAITDQYDEGNEPFVEILDRLTGGSKKMKFYCHMERKTGKVVKQGVVKDWVVTPQNVCVPEKSVYMFGITDQHNDYINAESYVSAKHAVKLAIEYRQKTSS